MLCLSDEVKFSRIWRLYGEREPRQSLPVAGGDALAVTIRDKVISGSAIDDAQNEYLRLFRDRLNMFRLPKRTPRT